MPPIPSAWSSTVCGSFAYELYPYYISGTQFEQQTRLAFMLMTVGIPLVPVIVQRMGDEMPFRKYKPMSDSDIDGATQCCKCMKWVPRSQQVIVEGRVYCRAHARRPRQRRPIYF